MPSGATVTAPGPGLKAGSGGKVRISNCPRDSVPRAIADGGPEISVANASPMEANGASLTRAATSVAASSSRDDGPIFARPVGLLTPA